MRAREFIVEKRKNPKQNPKTPIRDVLKKRREETTDTILGVINLFASFTKKDKLGINPRLDVNYNNTPLGIYAYNADYILDRVKDDESMAKLPYAGNSAYINIFNVQGNIINLGTITESEVKTYYKRIIDNITGVETFNEIIDRLNKYEKLPINEEFWAVTQAVALKMAEDTKTKYERFWNTVFRTIGIDGAIDPGLGIIFEKSEEPNQAVFFSLKPIQNNERHLNKYQTKNIDTDFKKVKTVDDLEEFSAKYNIRFLKDYAPRITTDELATYFANKFGGTVLDKLPRRFVNEKLISNMIQHDLGLYNTIPDQFKSEYPNINYLVISINPNLISRVPQNLITTQMADLVLKQNKKLIDYIPEHAMTDDWVTDFIQNNGVPNNSIKQYLNNNKHLVLKLLKDYPMIWTYLTPELKSDKALRTMAENGWLKTKFQSLIPKDLQTPEFLNKLKAK